MGIAFKKYKRIFRRNLQPVFAMLAARKRSMDRMTWMALVNETLQHVVANPAEYVGNDLPHSQLTQDVIDEIRTEFLREAFTLLDVPRA